MVYIDPHDEDVGIKMLIIILLVVALVAVVATVL